MESRDVAVATMTFARGGEEERLLRDALAALSAAGMPVFVADGGSSPAFCEFLASLPRVHAAHPRAHGLVGQVAASLQAAALAQTPFVLYTEPDKHAFFRDDLADFISRAPSGEQVGIVVAARSPAGMATFPAVQRRTEFVINEFTSESVGRPADYSYGPFLVRRALIPYLDRVPAEIGWGWRHFLFALAHRLGHAVEIVEGDYECPPGQRAEDASERIHRLKQLGQNVQGLVLGETMPGNNR